MYIKKAIHFYQGSSFFSAFFNNHIGWENLGSKSCFFLPENLQFVKNVTKNSQQTPVTP